MKSTETIYYHPLYSKAQRELEVLLMMKEDVLTYYKEFDEKLRLADLYGKTILVSETQFPELHNIECELADKFNGKIIPMYVYEDFYYGVEAKGATNPWIEISAKTVQDLSLDEIKFLLAR